MKIDMMYELEMPKPWVGAHPEYDLYWQSMEQIELADKLGFDTVWMVEHHGRTEFSHSSAPEVFLAAASQRTQNIRIGHGVVLLPIPFNHPVRAAERAAALDILSNGRLEFGVGRSSMEEHRGFRIPTEETRAMMLEGLEMIPQMWNPQEFSWKGHYYDLPPRNVIPKPYQNPHPPLWMASTSPDSWALAGERQVGALGLTVLSRVEELEKPIGDYRKSYKQGKPVGAFGNDQVRLFTIVHCAETDEKAMENGGGDAAVWYVGYILNMLLRWEIEAQEQNPDGPQPYRQFLDRYDYLQGHAKGSLDPSVFAQEDMIITGSPETCIKKIEKYREIGIDGILCLMQAGRIKHEDVKKSIELFGKHVIPHFKKNGPATS
ncbi:LLM class flavin-dependent oxidoreductase [Dehalococcoidia bacterium]|nr:LLM class flavin-dependent oxidoreductase [Dehalococcoidia bacterium]